MREDTFRGGATMGVYKIISKIISLENCKWNTENKYYLENRNNLNSMVNTRNWAVSYVLKEVL